MSYGKLTLPPASEVFNTDCLEYMRTLPDKAFQLAIADPPYGIEADRNQMSRAGTQHGASMAKCKDYGASEWDKSAPKTAISLKSNHYFSYEKRNKADKVHGQESERCVCPAVRREDREVC